jgi:hypothetical protein
MQSSIVVDDEVGKFHKFEAVQFPLTSVIADKVSSADDSHSTVPRKQESVDQSQLITINSATQIASYHGHQNWERSYEQKQQ